MENYPAITFRYKSRNMEKKLLDNGKLSSNNIPLLSSNFPLLDNFN